MVEMILSQYQLPNVHGLERVTTGLIHETYRVGTSQGDFILQKVHPIFGKAMMEDVDAISQEFIRQGMTAQTVVRTKDGDLYVEHDGGWWRLLTFIPGEIFENIRESNIAYEAGKMLGSFHRALDGFKYEFKHSRLLHHNTAEHLRLLKLVDNHADSSSLIRAKSECTRKQTALLPRARGRVARCLEETAPPRIVQESVELVLGMLPKLLLPHGLRKTITQGDPKITNFIFQNQKAVALIDIDDVGREHNVLIELGDAFRSWCSRGEDDEDNRFDIALFESGLRGYQEGSRSFLLKEEFALLPQAIQLITLELAARFLRDYFENNYFGWDQNRYSSRQAHNLARARGQLRLHHSLVEQNNGLWRVIHSSA